jgi:hypothetical protein
MNPKEKQMAIELQVCRALLMACVGRPDTDERPESGSVASIVMEYLEASATEPLHVEALELISTIESFTAKPLGEFN